MLTVSGTAQQLLAEMGLPLDETKSRAVELVLGGI